MSKTTINTDKAPLPIGPYSQAVKAGSLLFISGQLGMRPGDSDLEPTLSGQAKQALENLSTVLEAAGCSTADVVKTTCFLADMADFAEFNEVYGTFFTEDPPARSAFAVKQLPKSARVEVEAIAVIP